MEDFVIVTDWEEVESDDFYLTDDKWAEYIDEETVKESKELQEVGNLYIGYIVTAKNYVLYSQMDSEQVFIDREGNVIMHCEGCIIGNSHVDTLDYS